MEIALTVLGLATLMAIIWSIAFPTQRLWPPLRYTRRTPMLVWVPTFVLFGVLVGLGVFGWGQIELPQWVRLGLGAPLIIFGNVAVWIEVSRFGIPQTGGEGGILAPFAGEHGWFWRNRDDEAVTVTLEIKGDYSELVQGSLIVTRFPLR